MDDLYTILGNFAADEAAKIINAQEMPVLQAACQNIRTHSKQQTHVLSQLYAYLAGLNSLHKKLKLEKEKRAAETHVHNVLEEVIKYQEVLPQWNIQEHVWQFNSPIETARPQRMTRTKRKVYQNGHLKRTQLRRLEAAFAQA